MTNIKIILLLSLATCASYGDEEITDNLVNETETKIQTNEASDTTSPENKIIADLEIQTEPGTAPSESKIIADVEIQTESGTASSENETKAKIQAEPQPEESKFSKLFDKCICLCGGTSSPECEIAALGQKKGARLEISILWDTIRGDRNYINEETFLTYYKDEEQNKLSSVMKEFGHPYLFSQSDTKPEYIMCFDEFARAASQGYIQICSTQAMITVFKEILWFAHKRTNKKHVTLKDMAKYYGSIIPLHQRIYFKTYRKKSVFGRSFRLTFLEFKKAINMGVLPKPVRDVIAFQTEIEYLFHTMKTRDYVSYSDMCCYFEDYDHHEFANTTREYGTAHDLDSEGYIHEYRMEIDKFKEIGSMGLVPRYGEKLMKNEFMKIIPKRQRKKREYVTFKELTKYYEKKIPLSQLEYITSYYGEKHDKEYRLNFNDFKRATNSYFFPDLLSDKITAIYTLFKNIIPKTDSRNHILLKDAINYFGTETYLECTLVRLFKKYGKFEHGGQYLLYFPDFKRALNYGNLKVPK